MQDQGQRQRTGQQCPQHELFPGIDAPEVGGGQQRQGDQHQQQEGISAQQFPRVLYQVQPGIQIRGTSTDRTSSVSKSSTRYPSTSASAVKITRWRSAGRAMRTTSSGTA